MIVLDNSVLSAFRRIQALQLLSQLYGTVFIPQGVQDEFKKNWTSSTLPAWLHVENLKKDRMKMARQLKLGRSLGMRESDYLQHENNQFIHRKHMTFNH